MDIPKLFVSSRCSMKNKEDNPMINNEEKITARTQTPDEPQSKEQVLVFSHQLRREIETACRQLDNREGQNNLTINEEVKGWLNK